MVDRGVLFSLLLLAAACGGEPEPEPDCADARWDWVFVGSDDAEHVAIDAVSVTTREGAERFTTLVMEWQTGDDNRGGHPSEVLGRPDGECVSLPHDAMSFIAEFDGEGDAWNHVTVYTCDGDGTYDIELLRDRSDAGRAPATSGAHGTRSFATASCDDHEAGVSATR